MSFAGYIAEHGIIRFLIVVYCMCIIYIVGYTIYRLYKFVRLLTKNGEIAFNKKRRMEFDIDETNFVPYMLLDKLAYFIFLFCICTFWALSHVFLVLYLIYAAARFIGLHWLLLAIFKIFRDCKLLGIFDLFDDLADALIGPYPFFEKFGKMFIATSDFLENFFEESYGLILPGYKPNDWYMNAMTECLSGNCTEDMKKEIAQMMTTEYPLVKVNILEEEIPSGSYMDMTVLNNCIKYNTIVEKGDESTIDTLKIILTNEFAKDKCLTEYKAMFKKDGDAFSSTGNESLSGIGTALSIENQILNP